MSSDEKAMVRIPLDTRHSTLNNRHSSSPPPSFLKAEPMNRERRQNPIASVTGALAVAVWAVYVLLAAFYAPDFRPSVLTIGIFGFLACLAVIMDFARWRLVVILASVVHLSFYVVQIVRMATMTSGFEISALLPALSFYYGMSWRVAAAMFQEKGTIGGLVHGYLEFAMPILCLALIVLALASRRAGRSAA